MRGTKDETPLRMTVRILCAQRGWSLKELAAVVSRKVGEKRSPETLLNRMRAAVPTEATYTELAAAFGLPRAKLETIVKEETARARKAGGRVADPTIRRPCEAL